MLINFRSFNRSCNSGSNCAKRVFVHKKPCNGRSRHLCCWCNWRNRRFQKHYPSVIVRTCSINDIYYPSIFIQSIQKRQQANLYFIGFIHPCGVIIQPKISKLLDGWSTNCARFGIVLLHFKKHIPRTEPKLFAVRTGSCSRFRVLHIFRCRFVKLLFLS